MSEGSEPNKPKAGREIRQPPSPAPSLLRSILPVIVFAFFPLAVAVATHFTALIHPSAPLDPAPRASHPEPTKPGESLIKPPPPGATAVLPIRTDNDVKYGSVCRLLKERDNTFDGPRASATSVLAAPFLTPERELPWMEPQPSTLAVLGTACEGLPKVWTKTVDYTTWPVPDFVLAAPRVLELAGDKRVLLVAASPRSWRFEGGHVAASIVRPDGSTSRLIGLCCEGGQWWSEFGNIAIPAQQPAGRLHIWSISGLRWMDNERMWFGINDVTGDEPLPIGVFPWSGSSGCSPDVRPDTDCAGYSFELVDAAYRGTAPTTLTLTWKLETWIGNGYGGDEQPKLRKSTTTATYILRDRGFDYVGDGAPPGCRPMNADCISIYTPQFLDMYRFMVARAATDADVKAPR